jgi:hypothetical protein
MAKCGCSCGSKKEAPAKKEAKKEAPRKKEPAQAAK